MFLPNNKFMNPPISFELSQIIALSIIENNQQWATNETALQNVLYSLSDWLSAAVGVSLEGVDAGYRDFFARKKYLYEVSACDDLQMFLRARTTKTLLFAYRDRC